jgi:hypothetical protein
MGVHHHEGEEIASKENERWAAAKEVAPKVKRGGKAGKPRDAVGMGKNGGIDAAAVEKRAGALALFSVHRDLSGVRAALRMRRKDIILQEGGG